MNSFSVTAIGNLAKNPELIAKGETAYTRFCLIGNDYAGKDEGGAAREVATSLWFVAFGPLGEAIARNARKGDQLLLDARIRANNWTDSPRPCGTRATIGAGAVRNPSHRRGAVGKEDGPRTSRAVRRCPYQRQALQVLRAKT
jgi:single-stranded DNA-binding protein